MRNRTRISGKEGHEFTSYLQVTKSTGLGEWFSVEGAEIVKQDYDMSAVGS